MAYSIATVVSFASLGLVALAMGLLTRGYSTSALATGLTGILAMTIATTSIIPGPLKGKGADPPEIERIRADLKHAQKQLREAREQLRSELAKRDQAESKAVADKAKAAALNKKLLEVRAELAQEQHQLGAAHDELASDLREQSTMRVQAESRESEVSVRAAELGKKMQDAHAELARSQDQLRAARQSTAEAQYEAELSASKLQAERSKHEQFERDKAAAATKIFEFEKMLLEGRTDLTRVQDQLRKARDEVKRLASALQNSRAKLAQAKREQATAVTEFADLDISISESQAKLDQVRNQAQEAQQFADRAQAKLASELSLEKANRSKAEREKDAAIAKTRKLERKLAEAVPPESEQSSPLCQNPPCLPAVARGLREMLDSGHIDTSFFTSTPLAQHELVAGLKGRWYVMRLKLGDKPLVFADRQFRIPKAVQEIKESARRIRKALLDPIAQAAKNIRLFLRGGADSRSIAGTTEVPGVQHFFILPRQADGTYVQKERAQVPNIPVRNEDLPNLRADWLREQIRSELSTNGSSAIALLDNPPGPNQQRSVELIVYVEW